MELRSDRRFRFDVDAPTLWTAIAAVDDYQRWWPWLRSFDGQGLVAGAIWRCVVQPPLPYALRFTISLDEVVPPTLVVATIAGDVSGVARLELEESTTGCEVRLVSALSPTGRGFRLVAFVARPAVRAGHDWVLDTGAHQFVDRAV